MVALEASTDSSIGKCMKAFHVKSFIANTPADKVWIVRFKMLYNVTLRLWPFILFAEVTIGNPLAVR